MVYADLFQLVRCDTLAWLEQIYLKAHFDLLGKRSLRKDCLHLGHNGAGHHAALRSDGVHLLADARHNCKVLRKVVGDESANATTGEVIQLVDICFGWQTHGISNIADKVSLQEKKQLHSPSGSKQSFKIS